MTSKETHETNGSTSTGTNPVDLEHQARADTLVVELPKSLGAGVSFTSSICGKNEHLLTVVVCIGPWRIRYNPDDALIESYGMARSYRYECFCCQLLLHRGVWFGDHGAVGAVYRQWLCIHSL